MAKTSTFTPKGDTYVASATKTTGLPQASRLLAWYDKYGRDLPWREHEGRAASPYHTWISEIMLQQTGVSTVIPYYQRFITRWPTVKALAAALQDDVLSAWAGLGYYSRARNLHECAKQVTREYDGKFPSELDALKKLPGIGPYTASAIRAIAFDLPANVVDGNVERVVTRIFGYDKPINDTKNKTEIHHLAAQLVPSKRNGDYAQALMDLGAVICTPKNPVCNQCPWRNNCNALATNRTSALPVTTPKKAVPTRYTLAFLITDKKGRVFLRRRPPTGLLGSLWEIPTTEWRPDKPWRDKETQALPFFNALGAKRIPREITHVFSHFKLVTKLYVSDRTPIAKKLDLSGQWFAMDALPAVATLTKKMLTAAKELGEN